MARVPFEVAFVKLTKKRFLGIRKRSIRALEKLEDGLKKNPIELAVKPESLNERQEMAVEPPPKPQTRNRQPQTAKNSGLNEITLVWPAVLNYVKERKISVAMYLKEGFPRNLN